MATKDPQDNLTFRGFLKASGQAQSWDDTDKKKASKFGWKTETAYSTDTLVGNWNEEWFDVSKLSQSTRPLSQYSYCFETTYKKTYDKSPPKVPEVLKYRQGSYSTVLHGSCIVVLYTFCKGHTCKSSRFYVGLAL